MESLLRETYIMRDASSKREPRDFAQRMLRTAKDAGINDVGLQLDMIYTNIDLSLRMYLQRLTDKSTIDSFLIELDDRKYEWWAFANKKLDSSYRSERAPNRNNGQRPFQNQNQGQYPFRQPFSGMSYRPGGDSYPYNESNNPYGANRPFVP